MGRALELARSERPHPNPRVGAVIVDRAGAVVAEGAHEGPGLPHAEVLALRRAGSKARGATLYVTLEPCNHVGRTGPCVDAIIEAGVDSVVMAAPDPNPDVTGNGADRLREAGVRAVFVEPADHSSDPAYFHYHRTGLPLVTLKAALTLDGSIAARDGSSQWISNEASRRDAHELRARHDAVVVGAGTVRADDPELTVRLTGYTSPQPVPVVVKGSGELPVGAKVLARDPIISEPGPDGMTDLEALCRRLADRGLLDVLVEGGATLARSFWDAGLIHRGIFYYGAKVAGGSGLAPIAGTFANLSDARAVTIVRVDRLGGDVRLEFDVHGHR